MLYILPCREKIVNESQDIIESLDRFWKHESMGNEGNQQQNNVSPIKIEFIDNQRYGVSLPWKGTFVNLNSNSK